MSTAILEAETLPTGTVTPTPTTRHTRGRGLAGGAGRLVRRSAAVVLFLLLWEYGTQYLLDPARKVFLPPLHEVLRAWWGLAESGQLQQHVTASLTRSVIGFSLAVVAGIALWLVVAWYDGLREFLRTSLSGYKLPRALTIVPEVPRNATGKAQYPAAKEMALKDRVTL